MSYKIKSHNYPLFHLYSLLKFDLFTYKIINNKSNLIYRINKMTCTPTLTELPLRFSTYTDISSVFNYETFAVSVNYYVLRSKEKKNS